MVTNASDGDVAPRNGSPMETEPGEFTRFTMPYRFALDEVTTKLSILREEFNEIHDHIRDIAGVRVVCSFVSDVYTMFDLLTLHPDIDVSDVDDYIASPKPNGYRSLHATITVPVLQSHGIRDVFVEVQFRTAAMDSWASLEHKLFYKYGGHVPDELLDELRL